MTTFLTCFLTLGLFVAATVAQERVRVGIILDGPWDRDQERTAKIQRTVRSTLSGTADVVFPENAKLQGDWTRSGAKKALDQLLPQGVATEGQFLYEIVDTSSSAKVGIVWHATRELRGSRHAWLYDIRIDPMHRRQGFARAALHELELLVRRQGLGSIRLHVFAHNVAAHALYEELGYETKHVVMEKALGGTESCTE